MGSPFRYLATALLQRSSERLPGPVIRTRGSNGTALFLPFYRRGRRRLGIACADASVVFIVTFLFGFIFFLVFPITAQADDASLGRRGETVRVLHNDQVAMVEETVTLTLVGVYRTKVDATFVFRNDGPAKTVLMGFPEGLPDPQRDHFGDDLGLHDFKTWIDGRPIPVKREKGWPGGQDDGSASQYPYWWTWELPFAARETRVVRNSYWVKNHYWSNGTVLTGYILETGASWKGAVGRVKVALDLGPVLPFQLEQVKPAGYRFEDGKLVWEWSGLEPKQNIEVLFNPRLGSFPEPSQATEQAGQIFDIYTRGLDQLDYRNLLAQLEDYEKKNPALKEVDRNYLLRLEARCRFLLGGRSFAEDIWKDKSDLDAYYFLAIYYKEQGNLEQLKALVQGAGQDRRITAPLMSFLRQLLPPELRSSSPPQLKEVADGPILQIQAADPDGDLKEVSAEISYQKDGVQMTKTITKAVQYPLPGVFDLWEIDFPPPLTVITYRFRAVDEAGLLAETPARTGLWLPPEMGWERKEIQRKGTGSFDFYVLRNLKGSAVPVVPKGVETDLFRPGDAFLAEAWKSLGLIPPERTYIVILSSEKELQQLTQAAGNNVPSDVLILLYEDEPGQMTKSWQKALLKRLFLAKGPRWVTAPAWFWQGALDAIQGKNSLERGQVLFLRRQGPERWADFLAAAGQEGFQPALNKCFGLTENELASRVTHQRMGFSFLGGVALLLVMLLGLPRKYSA